MVEGLEGEPGGKEIEHGGELRKEENLVAAFEEGGEETGEEKNFSG